MVLVMVTLTSMFFLFADMIISQVIQFMLRTGSVDAVSRLHVRTRHGEGERREQ